MQNIVIIAPAIAHEGITKLVAIQIIGFLQKGIKVSLIVLAKSDIEGLKELSVDVDKIPILQLQQSTSYLSVKALINSIRIVLPIIKFLRKQEVEIVIAHAPYAHFIMRLVKMVANGKGLRLIQYFHGLQYSEYPINTWRRQIINGLNKWMARRFDDKHISVSEIVKDEISNNLTKHCEHYVVYNCLVENYSWNEKAEQEWQQIQLLLNLAKDKYVMLLPNRIDYNKGQLFFLKVLKGLLQLGIINSGNLAVFIVGDGPQRREVEQQVQVLDLGNIVSLTGILPNVVVQRLMKVVDLVVVPSFLEGFSFAVLEALQSKCLILASDAGGIKELVRHEETGFLFETGNKEDCLNKLIHIYQNKHRVLLNYKKMEIDVKTKFSLEQHLNQLLRAFKS
ncbi:glycosyltransferase family 4 protein [Pontibacter sp. 13R65]|uniref:glycosyltransferase family 4 protein n=1 Tax=Pontibacter sp. 13R65 TaxID=3127458 RepID=UPI00301CCA10